MSGPVRRGEFIDFAFQVIVHSLQDIDQVGVGIDSVHFTGYDETLENAHVFGPHFRPAEHPVLAAHWNDSQRSLQFVGVQRNIGVIA